MRSPVNRPSHYADTGPQCRCGKRIECIDIAEVYNFNRGNAIKYVWRAGHKHKSKEVEDLEKAIWYLKREIRRIQHKSRGVGRR